MTAPYQPIESYPSVVLFIAASGFRRKLDIARLSAAGLELVVADRIDEAAAKLGGVIPANALLLLSPIAAYPEISPPCWVERIGASASANDGAPEWVSRITPLAPDAEPEAVARLAEPHGSPGAALEPTRWEELGMLLARAPDRMAPIFRAYLEGVPGRKDALEAAHLRRDLEGLARQAHGWKGAAAGVGADRLADALGRLDQLARAADATGSEALLSVIHLRSSAATEALDARLDP